jgi:hypothetical protein
MKIEFLGNFNNILIAVSSIDSDNIDLAFTDDTSLASITVHQATIEDFNYLVKRFNLDYDEIISWFNSNQIDILSFLPS